jgi:hypothetical protein
LLAKEIRKRSLGVNGRGQRTLLDMGMIQYDDEVMRILECR